MTSTEFTIGLDGSRVSSKVLKPPGGGSSDIFGLGATQHSASSNDQLKSKDNSTQSRLFASAPNDSNVISTPQRKTANVLRNENQAPLSVSKKQYVRRNPITGEGIEFPDNEKDENKDMIENDDNDNDEKKTEVENKPDAPKVIQTSIRIRNPPGGKSSGIF